MAIANLIFTILTFVCSFTPILGIPFVLFFGIVAIILAIITRKKHKSNNEKEEVSIISLIIVSISVIICIIVNVLSIDTITKIMNFDIN